MRLLNEIRNYMGNYHVKSGVYHYYRNEFSQAVNFLRKALGDDPKLSEADEKNARCYLTLSLKGLAEKLAAEGEVEAGVKELREAVKVSPDYPDVHYLTGRLLERADRSKDAIKAYEKAIEVHPNYFDARVALGYCLLATGKVKEASRAFKDALNVRVKSLRTPFKKGLELLDGGDVDSALTRFHEVFLAVPQLSEEYLGKAREWLRAEEHERALADFERALALNPQYPDLHNYRGIVLCELDRYDEAFEAFRRSVELSPGHLVPRLNLAFAQLRAGQQLEAEAELKSILEDEPTEPVANAKLDELRSSRATEKRGLGARS